MARKRVAKEEKQQRHQWAMKKIDQGVGFSELASLVAETWGCSRRQARRVVADAHKEWMDVCFGSDDIDQRDLLFKMLIYLIQAFPTGKLTYDDFGGISVWRRKKRRACRCKPAG